MTNHHHRAQISSWIIIPILLVSFVFTSCHQPKDAALSKYRNLIILHQDQEVMVYGSYAALKLPVETGTAIWNPVQIVRGPDSLMYVSNHTGEIYALVDTDEDGIEDHARFFCDVRNDNLRAPASILFKGRDLYVGTAREVRIYSDRDGDGVAEFSEVFFDQIPHSEHPYEWSSGLTFGPDGHLYLVLTTDSWNAGAAEDPNGWRGAVLRISPDGSKVERYATGLRSVPAMIFDQYNELWLIDNQGGGNQVEELNLVQRGGFYGHNPEKYQSPVEIEATFELKTDIAPSGMTFNPTSNDFDSTGGDLFVSFYGPGERWNRGSIGRVRMSKAPDGTYLIEEFKVLEGLAKVSDLEFGFQGDLYTTLAGKTDYWYQELDEPDGAIYKIVYAPWVKPVIPEEVDNEVLLADVEIMEEGRQLFLDRACNACHAIDGKTELLGPNLKDVGRNFSREELLEEIEDPSARIKPSMAPTRIIKKNGESLLGRVVSNNPEAIRIMITGNRIVDVPKNEIQKEEKVLVSMMYEGLLEGLAEQEVDALLTYLESLGSVNQ